MKPKALLKSLIARVFPPTPPPTPPASDIDDTSPLGSDAASSFGDSKEGSINKEQILESYSFPLPPPSLIPSRTLDVDLDTPDHHVPRDSRLIRLTGIHPFNVEAPLTALFNSGFLTPPELHFVRNHGPVPQVHEDEISTWEVSIEGLVENPLTIKFSEISSQDHFPQYTLPVTLVCAGNRRKEQNMVRKSQGFSWGSAGTSTSLWTGPMLYDIINAARPDRRRARYVCFEGGDKLPMGAYGTSLKFNWVMDPIKGIMLAYKMNGELLTPDHGRPLRVIVPGMIGGRSVKWLKRIIISDQPSTNHYHYHDNKVMPTFLTPQFAGTEEGKKFWLEEKWNIYDLNVNSVIACPAHDEILEIEPTTVESYTLKGYAYAGGGRRIQRVEISLDKGKTWRPSKVTNYEDEYRKLNVPSDVVLYGGKLDVSWRDTCFCWVFWDLDVPLSDLMSPDVSDICVRAMDESLHTQPRDMYWSLLGMMNNPWFRVCLQKETLPDGRVKFRFEHPTQPALMKGGWMERIKNEGGDLTGVNWGEKSDSDTRASSAKKEEVKMTDDSVRRIIEIDEFRDHASKEKGGWFAVEGEVYDGTPFLDSHPGGAQSIIVVGGTDCTEEFQAIHSETAKAMMPQYHIGTLSPAAKQALSDPPTSPESTLSPSREIFLCPSTWLPTKLTSKTIISHDTILLTFSLDHATQSLGLPVGQHIMVRVPGTPQTGNKAILRAYTPISHSAGQLVLLIKVYRDLGVDGQRGGVMSQELDKLIPGESEVAIKGPIGRFTYHSDTPLTNVEFSGSAPRRVQNFLMVCAGTGITPIYQVLESIAHTPQDSSVRCFVAYGNRNEDDMLCREELDKLLCLPGARDRIKIVHTLSGKVKTAGLSETEGGAEVRRGRVSAELVEEAYRWLGEGREGGQGGMMVLACGPEGLENGVKTWMKDEERRSRWGIGENDLCVF